MRKPHPPFSSAVTAAATCFLAVCISSGSAHGQVDSPSQKIYSPHHEVRIGDLPSLIAASKEPAVVLATSVEMILRDKEVCCGKDSALEDSVERADPLSLKDVAEKLRGRHLLADGIPITITAEFQPAATVNAGELIAALMDKRALLMEWSSHLYVICGAIFSETIDPYSGVTSDAIDKLYLLDTRFSGSRRELSFSRETDDWGKVQGILMLKAARQ